MTRVALSTVQAIADELGFGMCGVAPARPSDHADHARRWVADGKHGEMAYLAEQLETRLDPAKLLPGVRSVIVVADAYAASRPACVGVDGDNDRQPRGRIARYASGRDYHRVIKRRLHGLADHLRERHPDAGFRACVDTAPVLEREHAERAGLGWTGKHTLLLHPRHGSYFLLGLILTTLDIETAEDAGYPGPLIPPGDHCANCTRCIDACPTDAIEPAGYTLDARRCISYLTIEHRGDIDAALQPKMHDWIAGCDVCQEVCPYNAVAQKPGNALPVLDDYAPRGHAHGLPLRDVVNWTEEDRIRHTAGTALTRVKLPMWKRNAGIALANAENSHPSESN